MVGIASRSAVGRWKPLLVQLPGRFCTPRAIDPSSSIMPGQPIPMKGARRSSSLSAAPDEGRDPPLLFGGAAEELVDHLGEPFHRLVALGLVVGMAPEIELLHL